MVSAYLSKEDEYFDAVSLQICCCFELKSFWTVKSKHENDITNEEFIYNQKKS